MLIRKTETEHIPQMLAVYEKARQYMRRSGNLQQWSDSYPSEDTIRTDMARDGSYVCVDDDGAVSGAFFFSPSGTTIHIITRWLN